MRLFITLLGIRSTIKADLGATPAELVYGTTRTLPADMFAAADADPVAEPNHFVDRLRRHMRDLVPVLSRPVHNRPAHVPSELATCKYVFLRTDSARGPLQRPYTGPYEVLARNHHTLTIKTNNGDEDVALERVKPARVDEDTVSFDLPNRRGRPRTIVASLDSAHLGGSTVGADVSVPQSSECAIPIGTHGPTMANHEAKSSRLFHSRVITRSY